VDIARGIGLPAESRDSLEAALIATGHLGLMPAPRILITGSLYLAGEVLALNGTPPE
jgi:dihydrofolate synthase/folylpolyglutamate synthase